MQDGSELSVASRMGLPLEWSPQDPQQFLFQNSLRRDGSNLQHTFLHDLKDGTTIDVSQESDLNIQYAFWSAAEGEIIAEVKDLGEHAGSQFYAIQVNDFSKRQLTIHLPALPMAYDRIAESRYLLFEHSGILNHPEYDGIWVADLDEGVLTQLYQGGFQPRWLDWKVK